MLPDHAGIVSASASDHEISCESGSFDIRSTACFTKKGEFVTRSIARETILVPVRGQVGDLDAIYNLNEVGTFIWEHVNDITSVRQIADAVALEFEVTPEEAEKDTQQFIKDLEIARVIEQIGRGTV